MLINGIATPADTTTEQLLDRVKALPSSFPDYRAIHPSYTCAAPYDIQFKILQGRDLDKKNIIKHYTSALEDLEKLDDKYIVTRAIVGLTLIKELLKEGRNEEAYPRQWKAAKDTTNARMYFDSNELFSGLVKNAVGLGHSDTVMAEQEAILARQVALQGTAEYDQKQEIFARKIIASYAESKTPPDISTSRLHRKELFNLYQGPLVKGTVVVDEKGVGFSDSLPLSTINIEQCTVVIVHDNMTKRSALAHINAVTDSQSLARDVLDTFSPDSLLEVRLLGSRKDAGEAASAENLNKIMKILQGRENITIKSADIWHANIPTAVVFYPETGQLQHGAPETIPLETLLRTSAKSDSPTLTTYCDLTEGRTTSDPFYIDDNAFLEKIAKVTKEQTSDEIYTRYVQDLHDAGHKNMPAEWAANAIAADIALVEENAHQASLMAKAALGQAAECGLTVDIQKLEDNFRVRPKYVGTGAEEKNMLLVEEDVKLWRSNNSEQTTTPISVKMVLDPSIVDMLADSGVTAATSNLSSSGKASSTPDTGKTSGMIH